MTIQCMNKGECDRFAAEYDQLLTVGYLGKFVQRAAKKYGTKTALVCQDKSISYQELYWQACLVSAYAQSQGVQPRERILLLCENSLEFYAAYYGILQIGAVVVPLNTFLHERELTHIIADAQPKLIIVHSGLRNKIVHTTIPIATEIDLKLNLPILPTEIDVVSLDPDEMAILLYTSGTTGFPKGVMLSSRNCMTNIAQAVARVSIAHDERLLGVLPFFHSFAQVGCIWGAPWVGATVIIVSRIERRLLLQGFTHRPTIFFGVPALFGLLCLLKTVPLDSVKYFVSGGDALSDKIRMAFALLYRRKICNGYGLTEASPLVSAYLQEPVVSATNVGQPFSGVECDLRDEEGTPVTVSAIGELWVKGDNIMLGYYNDEQATKAVLHKGWLRTGDFASIDSAGRVQIVGRMKDLIAHKGIKIYPQEIELILLQHSNVIMAAVIGKDDEASGQIPVAYVQLRQEQSDIEQELRDLCVKNCAPYKVPRYFFCSTKSLPMTPLGKVDKKRLTGGAFSSN